MSNPRLPSARTLDDRIEAQRLRLFEATAVVSLAQIVASRGRHPIDGNLHQNSATDVQFALQLAVRELNAVTEELEPGVILDAPPTAKEIAKRAIKHMQDEISTA